MELADLMLSIPGFEDGHNLQMLEVEPLPLDFSFSENIESCYIFPCMVLEPDYSLRQ